MYSEEETGRETTAQGRTTVETERRRQGHNSQVSSDGDMGKRHYDSQGESDGTSEGWSGGSAGDSAEETEEEGMTAGEQEGSGDTLMALPWGMQESGARVLQGGARAGQE